MNSVSQAYPSSTVSATEIKVENPHIDLYRGSGGFATTLLSGVLAGSIIFEVQ